MTRVRGGAFLKSCSKSRRLGGSKLDSHKLSNGDRLSDYYSFQMEEALHSSQRGEGREKGVTRGLCGKVMGWRSSGSHQLGMGLKEDSTNSWRTRIPFAMMVAFYLH